MSEKHSKLPWKIYPSDLEGCDGIYDADGDAVFVFERDSQDAINAPLIVRAVNSHKGLVEVFRNTIAELEKRDKQKAISAYEYELLLRFTEALALAEVKP